MDIAKQKICLKPLQNQVPMPADTGMERISLQAGATCGRPQVRKHLPPAARAPAVFFARPSIAESAPCLDRQCTTVLPCQATTPIDSRNTE
jgi:hypothetical protein